VGRRLVVGVEVVIDNGGRSGWAGSVSKDVREGVPYGKSSSSPNKSSTSERGRSSGDEAESSSGEDMAVVWGKVKEKVMEVNYFWGARFVD
jgi:hypothetical protein